MKYIGYVVISIIMLCEFSLSQNATIQEIKQKFRTYEFSDPSPIARMNNIYPYFRFDGFTNKPFDKEWKVVKLENPYIEVYITPEIGGKIWGAVEKSTGFPFIYFNKTVKFRDIAMRGPWTSGGIEFNFGDIGHTPATATPVNYLLKENKDGSVSCFVSAIDLPSRTTWVVEIKLEKDKAYFETRSFWYNSTEYNTSLYTWNNGAINSGDDLQLYYPGSNYIDHDGNLFNWPNAENGKNISIYAENNFGSYKSYHVIGAYTDYFGAYWKNSNIGSGHTSIYEDKPGKKIWIWGLAREGEIWTDLLTDKDLGNRQYVEVQTGMLFNQAMGSKTPFRRSFFEPGALLRFSEMWFPFKNTGGISEANEYGVLNVVNKNDVTVFSFCPLRKIDADLNVFAGDSKIYGKKINLNPLQPFTDSVKTGDAEFKITIGDNLISFSRNIGKEKLLNRPNTPNLNFDRNSLYGKYLQALELDRSREYNSALAKSLEVLDIDSNYLPALTLISELYYRRLEYQKALDYIKRALQIDTYDADANYWYGVISKKLKNYYDAKDAFGIASRSMKYKSAAYQNIAEMYFVEKKYQLAEEFAMRSIEYNSSNITALRLLSIIYRLEGNKGKCAEALSKIESINPLEHFVGAEKYLADKTLQSLDGFKKMINCELPQETYLELAIYYYNTGLISDALMILKESPVTPIVNYWLAFLYDKNNEKEKSNICLNKAMESSPEFVFPFRNETFEVLGWADGLKHNWKTSYYSALLLWHKGRIEEANNLFDKCGDEPAASSFYITRANFEKELSAEKAIADYKKAVDTDRNNWRAYHAIIDNLNTRAEYKEALAYAKKSRSIFENSYIMEFDYAKTLMFTNEYEKCLNVLRDINILPNEGARDGHDVYRTSYLMLAIEKMKKSKYKDALKLITKSLEWPENLGAGKPFNPDVRIELLMEALCHNKLNEKKAAEAAFNQIDTLTQMFKKINNANIFITAVKYKNSGLEQEGLNILKEWNKNQPGKIPEWCLNQYNTRELIPIDSKSWFPIDNDYNFKLIYELFKSGVK